MDYAQRLTISVVIPTYNRSALVCRAIASVLRQSCEVLEILVVDDGSEEDVASVVAKFEDSRIKVIRHPSNLGPASARNTGIRAARGSLIALLDSDDEWMPEKLERQTAALRSSFAAGDAVVSGFLVHDSGKIKQIRLDKGYDVKKERVWGCHVSPGSTLLAYRSCFDTVGLFDEKLRRLEDWDWLIRFGDAHRMLVVPEPLVELHGERHAATDKVLHALTYIEAKHGKRFARLSASDSRKFRSTLAVEGASLEYRRGQLARAALTVIRAVTIYPFRNRVFFRALARVSLKIIKSRVFKIN